MFLQIYNTIDKRVRRLATYYHRPRRALRRKWRRLLKQDRSPDSFIDIFNRIENIEKQIDLTPISYRGVNYWFIYRHVLYLLLQQSKEGRSYHTTKPFSNQLSSSGKLLYASKVNIYSVAELLSPSSPLMAPKTVDFLFFTPTRPTATVRLETNGNAPHGHAPFFDCTSDPLKESLIQKGFSVLEMTILNRRNLGNHLFKSPQRIFFTPDSQESSILVKSREIKDLTTLNKISKLAKIPLNRRVFHMNLEHHLIALESYRRILKGRPPKAVFLHSTGFYLPLMQACRELDIPVVDIQHGQIANNINYKPWLQAPEGGYVGHTTHFLSWSQADADFITNSFHGHMKPIVYGNQWLSHPYSKTKAPIQLKHPAAIVCMQNQSSVPKELLNIIKANPTINFYIRPHPRYNYLEKKDYPLSERVIYFDDSNITLKSLIEVSDFVIAESSSSLLDAIWMDKAAFCFGKEGEVGFSREIQLNQITHLSEKNAYSLSPTPISSQKVKQNSYKDLSDVLEIILGHSLASPQKEGEVSRLKSQA